MRDNFLVKLFILVLLALALTTGVWASAGTLTASQTIGGGGGTIVCPAGFPGCDFVKQEDNCCFYTCFILCVDF